MALVKFKIFGQEEDGSPIRTIDLECDFLPRVGDIFNTFKLFDDLEAEGNHLGNHHSIVYDIEWWVEGNRAVPLVKLNRYSSSGQRLDVLRRHGWLPKGVE